MHRKITSVLAVMLFGCTLLFAQVQSGNITGTVRDTSGAVVPNATVAVVNLGTQAHRIVQSNSAGTYTVTGLQPGQYEITITSGNFAPFKRNLTVAVGGNETVDASLGVSASTTVEVVATNPAIEVNTQSLSATVTATQPYAQPIRLRNVVGKRERRRSHRSGIGSGWSKRRAEYD